MALPCRTKTNDQGLAEEIAQENLAALVPRWIRKGPPDSAVAFVFATARPCAVTCVSLEEHFLECLLLLFLHGLVTSYTEMFKDIAPEKARETRLKLQEIEDQKMLSAGKAEELFAKRAGHVAAKLSGSSARPTPWGHPPFFPSSAFSIDRSAEEAVMPLHALNIPSILQQHFLKKLEDGWRQL